MWRGLVWAVAWGWQAGDCEVVSCYGVGDLRKSVSKRILIVKAF